MAKPLRFTVQDISEAPESRVVIDRPTIGPAAMSPLSGPAQMNELPDWVGLSNALLKAVRTIQVGVDQKELDAGRAAGEAEILRSGFAAAVDNKTLPANANPYRIRGYRESLARHFAREEYANQMELGRTEYEKMSSRAAGGQVTGMPLALVPVETIMGRATKSLTDTVGVANPDLLADENFSNALAAARARYQDNAYVALTSLRNEHTQKVMNNTNALEARAVLLGQVNGTEPNGGVDTWVKASLFAGHADTAKVLFGAASNLVHSFITVSPDGYTTIDRERATKVLDALRATKINGVSVAGGDLADEFINLSETVQRAVNPPGSGVREYASYLSQQWGDPKSVFNQIHSAPNKDAAAMLLHSAIPRIMSGESGVPVVHRIAVVNDLKAIVLGVGDATTAVENNTYGAVVEAISVGDFAAARAAAGTLDGSRRVAADHDIDKAMNAVGEHLKKMPDFQRWDETLSASLKADGVDGHPAVIAAVQRSQEAAMRVAWRALSGPQTPENLSSASKEIGAVLLAHGPEIEAERAKLVGAYNKFADDIRASSNTGKSFRIAIEDATLNHTITEEQAKSLLERDKANNAVLEAFRSNSTVQGIANRIQSHIMVSDSNFRKPTESGASVVTGDGAVAVLPFTNYINNEVLKGLRAKTITTEEELHQFIADKVGAVTVEQILKFAGVGKQLRPTVKLSDIRSLPFELSEARVGAGSDIDPKLLVRIQDATSKIANMLNTNNEMPAATRKEYTEALIRLSGTEMLHASDIIAGNLVVSGYSVPIGDATFDQGFMSRQPMFDNSNELEEFIRDKSKVVALFARIGRESVSPESFIQWVSRQRQLVALRSDRK